MVAIMDKGLYLHEDDQTIYRLNCKFCLSKLEMKGNNERRLDNSQEGRQHCGNDLFSV